MNNFEKAIQCTWKWSKLDWNCCYGHYLHIHIFWFTKRLLQSIILFTS